MALQTLLLAIHVLGCCFGVGASTILDLRVVGLLSGRPVSDQDLAFARLLALFVRFGLLMLWLSGACFLVGYWTAGPELLSNPKLHAKFAILFTLTLNGIFIEVFIMPLLRRQRGRALFDGLSRAAQAAALMTGAVSATGWYTAFVLVAREWNFTIATVTILAAYAATAAVAGCAAILATQSLYPPSLPAGEPYV